VPAFEQLGSHMPATTALLIVGVSARPGAEAADHGLRGIRRNSWMPMAAASRIRQLPWEA
jgi:hypothetical protein